MTHLNSLFKTFHDICQPCSDSFPSELEKNLQLRRNQKFLIMQSTSFILLSLYVTLFKGNPNFTDFWFMSMFVINLIVFALLCRRHHTFFKWYYAAVITLSSPIALYLHKDGIFACWSVVYLAPMLLLYYSGCRWFYITQVGIQLLYMNCYFKDKMIEVLNERTSQDFVQDLMSCQMFAVFLSSIIIYNIGVSLIDNFKQDIVYTENQRKELEVQKTFVLSFSHEIRNLINTLTGNIQLSLLEKIPPKVKSSLEDAEVGASLLLQLINNILDTGNLDIGELDINHSNQTIHSTLEKTWRMCAYVLKAKNLKGKFRILKNLPRNIKLDHDRFMQIMINLIVNAVKFTDKGSVDVELEWVPSRTCVTEDCFLPSPFDDEGEGIFEKDQAFSILNDDFTIIGLEKKKWSSDRYNNCRTSGPGLLKVSVTDTGYGVSQDNLSKVFDRFSSQVFGDGAASNKLGTTIGLYVTKELCHRMGGDIKIFSKIDKGTSFIACIPAEQTLPEKHSQQVPPSLLSLGTFHDERKLRAMIVDDMNFNIVVLTNYLERMKVEVANTAVNGSDAFTKYVESVKMGKRFDVVTMDVEMPVMDGKEAARMIREYERENHLSPCFLVMISGNVCESEISQCMKHNGGTLANHFLKKPAIFEDVFRLINEYFSISSQTTISSIY